MLSRPRFRASGAFSITALEKVRGAGAPLGAKGLRGLSRERRASQRSSTAVCHPRAVLPGADCKAIVGSLPNRDLKRDRGRDFPALPAPRPTHSRRRVNLTRGRLPRAPRWRSYKFRQRAPVPPRMNACLQTAPLAAGLVEYSPTNMEVKR